MTLLAVRCTFVREYGFELLRPGATISESNVRANAVRRCDSVVGDRGLRC